MSDLLRFPHKRLRAAAIREYMAEAGLARCVCFSCGNAAEALIAEGVDTLHIGPHGVLAPTRWFTPAQIARAFPGFFDATSGHLPLSLMTEIGQRYRAYLGGLPDVVRVPSGSGETLVCLKLAYPETDFVAVYNLDEATEYSAHAPLNSLVKALSKGVEFGNGGRA